MIWLEFVGHKKGDLDSASEQMEKSEKLFSDA